jgi:pseudaminic acid synthase
VSLNEILSEYRENKTKVIAEISANHNLNKNMCFDLIDIAAQAGADGVKFQTYTADTLTINTDLPDFRISNDSPWAIYKNQYNLYKRAYTPWDWFPDLINYSKKRELIPFSSVFDESSVDFMESLNIHLYKLASVEINHIPLIKKIAHTGKPLIISLGVASEADLLRALKAFFEINPNGEIAILHCDTSYPASIENSNLRQIIYLQEKFDGIVGLSDHTRSLVTGSCAVMYGAQIIEKHITLESSKDSPDNFFSITQDLFDEYITNIRLAEKLIGKQEFRSKNGEENLALRRSIYPCFPIRKGEIVLANHLKIVRPGFSLPPEMLPLIIGKRANRNIEIGDRIEFSDFS